MRKIFASLFVIAAVLGVGVFATGAYFTDTVTQSNLTFRTSNADLKLGFCPGGLFADCSTAPANLDSFDFAGIDVPIGPGITNSDCMVFQNTGAYALTLTGGIASYTQSPSGMHDAFMVKAQLADSTCNPNGAVIFGSQSLNQAYNVSGPQPFGSLAPGARMYVVWSNSWNSAGDQNLLQGGWLLVNVTMTGQTS